MFESSGIDVIGQQLLEPFPRPEEAGFHGPSRTPQNFRNLLVGKSFDLLEDDDRPKLFRQLSNRVAQHLIQFPVFQHGVGDEGLVGNVVILAGLAGITTVSGTIQQLQPSISPGYGFTAIIVAFLGRLNPIGVLIAGLALALTYLGGEAAQVTMQISDKLARVFQGMLLFFVLGCDTLILYRVQFVSSRAAHDPVAPRTNLQPADEAV